MRSVQNRMTFVCLHSLQRVVTMPAARGPRGATLAGLIAWLVVAVPSSAEDGRAREPAFQGHAAEMQWRTAEQERRRRALYFDDVDAEVGEPGLPCDHLVRRKPEAVAGIGHVVVLRTTSKPRGLMRVWFPPGAAADLTAAGDQARALAAARGREPAAIVDQAAFAWCR